MHSKVIIIGSGPAGYTAAIYAARAGLETTILMGHMAGGQLMLTHEVQNYPGFVKVSGIDLMENFQKQAESVGVILKYEFATGVDFSKRPFKITTDVGNTWTADTVIIATGSTAKWLGINSEEKFKGHGIAICATCDGFFYKGKNVAVVGGGNSAAYEAKFLSNIAQMVYVIHRRDELRADKHSQREMLSNPKIQIRWDNEIVEFMGDNKLQAVRLKNAKTGDETILPVDGVFLAIGNKPNTEIFAGHLDLTETGFIKTDKKTFATSVPGVFACGDVQEETFRQAIIAAGSGCVAALNAEKFLMDQGG